MVTEASASAQRRSARAQGCNYWRTECRQIYAAEQIDRLEGLTAVYCVAICLEAIDQLCVSLAINNQLFLFLICKISVNGTSLLQLIYCAREYREILF